MSHPRRRWLWSIPLLVGAGVCYPVFGPDGFSIGPSSLPVEYMARRRALQRPLVSFQLFGKRMEWPDDPGLQPLPNDAAGILQIGPAQDDQVWRLDGVEYETTLASQIDNVGGWTNLVMVPYAPAPNRRKAEIRIANRWVPVTLPYEPGHEQPKDASPSLTSNGYTIKCEPIPRLGSFSYLDYRIQVEGPGSNCYTTIRRGDKLQRFYADGRPVPNDEDRLWRVAPGVSVQLEVEGGKAEKIPLRVTVTTFDYMPIKVALQDGTVLYDPATGVLPDFLGFSALEILDPSYRPSTWIVRDGFGRRMSRKSGETVRDAIGYKFRGSCRGQFTLRNPWKN